MLFQNFTNFRLAWGESEDRSAATLPDVGNYVEASISSLNLRGPSRHMELPCARRLGHRDFQHTILNCRLRLRRVDLDWQLQRAANLTREVLPINGPSRFLFLTHFSLARNRQPSRINDKLKIIT